MALSPTGNFDHAALRRLCKGRGWTQAELAEKCGVTEDTVYEWESARSQPTVVRLNDLASALSVEIGAFYSAPGSRRHLQDLRVMAGLTQMKLAKRLKAAPGLASLKINQTIISHWENARREIPRVCAAAYAKALGVTEEQLEDAARNTWRDAHKMVPWTPLVDQRQRDFKGIAAGDAELEFIYELASRVYALTEIVFERTVLLHQESNDDADELEKIFVFQLWNQIHLTIKDVRERSVAVINHSHGINEDVAERARSVIWTLDQYLTIAEDMLGLPREILTAPTGMFGRTWEPDTQAKDS